MSTSPTQVEPHARRRPRRPRPPPQRSGTADAPDEQQAASAAEPRPLLFAPATDNTPPRVCVVAEIGVNHDGHVEKAIELVDSAHHCGADAVKLQLFDPDHLLSNQAGLADYQKSNENDVFGMLQRLMLSAADLKHVRDAAQSRGLGFIVTPFLPISIR